MVPLRIVREGVRVEAEDGPVMVTVEPVTAEE